MFSYPLHLTPQTAKFGHKFVWELPIRLTHWVTAVAIVVLFSTGLYINWPVFSVQGEAAGNFLMGRFRRSPL